MLWLRRLHLRFRSLASRRTLDEQLRGELELHIAELKAEYLDSGMDEADADAAARRAFGSVASIEEQCRDQRRTRWVEDAAQDAKFALRTFAGSPVFTSVAVLTLALGIGATTAFFSTVYGILFRPLPYPEPHRLVEIEEGPMGVGPVIAMRDLSRAVEYAGYLDGNELDAGFGGELRRIRATAVTGNLARVLQVQPARGRWFDEAEEHAGRHQVAVLSHRAWRERFASDEAIIGRRIVLEEAQFEVVGVMPADFAFPSPDSELWFPVRRDPRNIGYMWGSGNLRAIGRLRDGMTVPAAQAEVPSLIQRILPMFPWRMPDEYAKSAFVSQLGEGPARSIRPKLYALAGAALLLLLIACGNVANLLLARAVQRDREVAMREALGAGRWRLLRQLVTENLLLGLAGGLAGLGVATLIVRILPALLPAETPRLHETGYGPALLGSAAAAMAVTILLFGIGPAVLLRNRATGSVVSRAATASVRDSRLSLALVGGELALATALLIGAALMARTLWQLESVQAGVQTTGILTAKISTGPSRCATQERCLATLDEIGRAVLHMPGVQAVNWTNFAPLEKKISAVAVEIEDHLRPPGAPAFVLWETAATPGYFSQLGVPLREGRLFNDSDRAATAPVIVISESTARRYWPHQSAIGKRIKPMSNREWRTVIGVVSDVAQYALTGYPTWIDGVQYVPFAQVLPRVSQSLQLTALVESREPRSTAAALERTVQIKLAGVAVSGVTTLEAVRRESVADQTSTALLLVLLAGIGLLLGIAGVHGVVAHRVAQRTREIGIRMALGASALQVVGGIVRETLAVAAAGLAVGGAAAWALSHLLRSLLFGITHHDPIAFAVCPVLLLIAAVLAASVPALRASRIDPAETLREA